MSTRTHKGGKSMTGISKMVEWLEAEAKSHCNLMKMRKEQIAKARFLAAEERQAEDGLLDRIKEDVKKSKLPGLNKVIVYTILSKYEVQP